MKNLLLDEIIPLLPKRTPESHKGTYGTLVSFVGSTLYRGAAVLSSMGALRCGVGILRVCTVEKAANAVISALPEATLLPYDGDYLCVSDFDCEKIFNDYRPTSALIGCGLGDNADAERTLKGVIAKCTVPLVIDASALSIIAKHPSILQSANADIIMTPHLGEFSRLCNKSIGEIKLNPEKSASEYAQKNRVILVLKGHYTIIATPDGNSYRSDYGNAGLATGGSGDILAGMIASLSAQGLSPADSAKCGVVLHGGSADLCAERKSKTAMLPHEISEDLENIYKKYGL